MATPLTSAEVAGVALLESLQAAASTPNASSTVAVAACLSACLTHAADLPYSILGDALLAAIKAGQLDAARQILEHNTQHQEQYAHSDEWAYLNQAHGRYKFSRDSHLATAVECALREGHSELLPAIHAAGLAHTDSSFADAFLAPTRAARVAGLRQAVELWGWPEGEARVDLLDRLLPADAPECLELFLRQRVKEDGEEELSPDYAEEFMPRDNVSESNRQLLLRVQADLSPFEAPHSA